MLQRQRELLLGDHGKPWNTGERASTSGSTWYDPTLYLLAFVIGLVPIVAVFVEGGSWGAEPTVGTLFCLFSAGALLRRGLGTLSARPDQCGSSKKMAR